MSEPLDQPASTVVVVRHGETDWNATGRFQGWAAVGLNERGQRQARLLGKSLAAGYDFDRVVASDLRRTRETTERLREAGVGPEPAYRATWRERDLGIYQGLTDEALHGDHPEFDPASGAFAPATRPENGESYRDLSRRVRDGWTALRETLAGETVLLVTHGGPLHVLHGTVAGEDLATAFGNHSHANCARSVFRVGEGDVSVACKNERTWAGPADD